MPNFKHNQYVANHGDQYVVSRRWKQNDMSDFSLDQTAELIHFGKSKIYFSEVLSCYNNGNYRSAVVMLWSVAVCDVVFKLQHLIDLYGDTRAEEILSEVTADQERDSRSSQWEIKLVDSVFEKTNLIDNAEYENLKHLQKQRHLAAHPVLNQDRELHAPNKETVRALLRNTLEGLLVKPPFYTQQVLTELLEDVAESKEALNTQRKVRQFVESRYFNRITAQVEQSIFRSLWKLVFKLDNEECNEHRLINLRVLQVISARKILRLEEIVSGEKEYFSNIASSGDPLSFLVYFLSQNSTVYEQLEEDAKLKIQHCVGSDDVGKTVGWFIKPTLQDHYADILNWIEQDNPTFTESQWGALFEIADSEEWEQLVCQLIGAYYARSSNFDAADNRFQDSISPHIHLFKLDALKFMLDKLEKNNQTWGRGRASVDHQSIRKQILEVEPNFNFEDYSNFDRTAAEIGDDDD